MPIIVSVKTVMAFLSAWLVGSGGWYEEKNPHISNFNDLTIDFENKCVGSSDFSIAFDILLPLNKSTIASREKKIFQIV